jgi:hypothetical protein
MLDTQLLMSTPSMMSMLLSATGDISEFNKRRRARCDIGGCDIRQSSKCVRDKIRWGER